MKVVLFCGGLGMRLREHSDAIPKPMVQVGYRPILWHLMKYYAHYGHNEFILCLGWKADYVKSYFLNYSECVSNDFTLQGGEIQLHSSDIQSWRITFVDTGLDAVIGQRLCKVRKYLEGEPCFLANYADGLSSLPLPDLIAHHQATNAIATCLCVKPTQSFHLIDAGADGLAKQITPVAKTSEWMNGGFFMLNQEIFDYVRPGEDLACEPFQRLIDQQKLACFKYSGFWGCMDTYKEKQALDDMWARGDTPWALWNSP
ncbi:MAG: glucose-1-phosphate cytidylyltransferase [Planctomycetales bacterium]|nr:glucose-1-phosphate cytidylyltransferase [Planctomycetales bacterium]